LVGIIFYKNNNHYIIIILSLNNIIFDNIMRCLFYGDLKSNIQIFYKNGIGFNNIRKSNIGCFFLISNKRLKNLNYYYEIII